MDTKTKTKRKERARRTERRTERRLERRQKTFSENEKASQEKTTFPRTDAGNAGAGTSQAPADGFEAHGRSSGGPAVVRRGRRARRGEARARRGGRARRAHARGRSRSTPGAPRLEPTRVLATPSGWNAAGRRVDRRSPLEASGRSRGKGLPRATRGRPSVRRALERRVKTPTVSRKPLKRPHRFRWSRRTLGGLMPPKCMADRAVSFRRGSETGHDRRVARFAKAAFVADERGL